MLFLCLAECHLDFHLSDDLLISALRLAMPMRLVVTASLLETMVEGVEGVGVERVVVRVHVVLYCNHYNKNLNQFI